MVSCYLCGKPCKSKFCSGGHRKLWNRFHKEHKKQRRKEKQKNRGDLRNYGILWRIHMKQPHKRVNSLGYLRGDRRVKKLEMEDVFLEEEKEKE